MSKHYRFTAFPTLHTLHGSPSILTAPIALPQGCTNDQIVASWAHLLRGYCGTDTVVFRVNGITSGVEFAEDGSMDWISEGSVENPSGGRWTGVFLNSKGFNPLDSQLYLTVDGGSAMAYINISTAVVPESYIHIICTHLHHLFTSTAHSVHTLSVLNPTPRHLPGPTLLHNLITFSTHDSLPALEFLHSNSSQSTYSYADLDILSTQFALKLLPHTTSTQRLIPVLLQQSPTLYIALIGILKAGCAFVPLPLDAPPQRLQFIVEDIKAPCIVCDPASSPVPNLPCVTPDEDTPTFSLASLMELPTTISPSDPAYVMYTSGTTGTPKGVLVSHYAAAQSLLAQDVLVPKSVGRWLQQAAPTFDVFVFEMFFPLMRGIVLVGCERAVMLRDLPGVVRRMAVDVVELTPTVAGGLLGKPEDIPGLKCLLTIGEMLTKGVVDMWRDVLVGMYGPTEAAIHCTASTAVERVGDIGTPFETVSAFVIAPYKGGEIEVLPVGCVGELVVGGPQLADGYINRPEQTREVFINSTRFGRLYRTGDRARVLPSRAIECLGRIGAGQVKIRGQRIELGEIEEVVLKTPGVKACVANVIKNTLVIWVSGATSKLAIIETCKKWLPAYMIPGDILTLPTLPRLASGKADRKLLEANYKNRIVEPKAITEDMNAFERVIAHEASLLLGTAPSKEVSLVSHGLDSMQAIRLTIALRKRGLEVETVDVIRSDTISGIAAGIEKGVGTSPRVVNEATQRRFEEVANASRELQEDQNVLKVIPCTSVQAAMLAETGKDSAAYCNWMLLSLPPNNNAAKVEAAVRKIIDANEILRTGFVVLEGGFAQVVYHTSRPSQFTLSNTIQKDWSVSVPQLLSPPFRVALVGGQLSVQIHHALYDGWCWDNIMSDLAAHLSGHSVAPRPQYQVVVEHELDTDNSSRIDYWRNALSGIEPVPFPCLTGKSDVADEVRQETATMSTGKEEYEGAARKFGVAPVVLVQAAWAMLWSLYVGESDVVVGNVLSGRTVALEGVENVIGPMIVTAPVRVNVRRQRSVREVVSEVAKRGREVLGNEIGLREVKKAWGGEGRLFESLLVWQESLTAERSVKIVDLKDMLEFPILLEVTPGTVDISLRATYQTSILPPAHTALILAQLDQFVTSIISNPDQTLTNLLQSLPPSALSIENPHIITRSITSTPSISHLVELAASRNPNAIAIDFADDIIGTTTESTTLTYHTFNTNANKLAYHLLSLGAKPDTLISICMEKSPILYISILAILKSGAAYAPITPETPNERKNQIIESGDIRIHLTTSDLAPEPSGVPQGVVVVCVDTVNTLWYSEANPDIQRSERDLAYAVFTSGSTGKPKGVLVENHAIVNHLRLLAEMYPAALGKRLLQFCTVAFDVSVFEIFFTWAMGMTLCVARKDVLLRDIESAINAFKITHLSMTPTVAALVNPDNVPSVEFLVTAGEGLNRKVFEAWTGRGLWTGYGPSETVNICTVRPNLRKEDHINTLGETFANTSTFVISQNEDDFCLLPRGAVGELCFGGAQVARGYLKQPELTARKFPTHPTYGRVYRSGDIGRLLSDGSIEFIGRIDDQVKIRGHRIELGEITSVLLRSAAVLDAAAIPVRKSSTDPYLLVAFVLLVSHQDKEFGVVKADQGVREILGVLFKALSASLPEYMVPAVLLPVTTIPMTATGKIDKKILEKTFFDVDTATVESYSEETDKEVDAQWSQVEMEIVGVVADVAQVTVGEIGRGTSIFKLGLDSISVIQLSNRIMKAGYKRLDVSQIMKNPTVGALATLLGEMDEGQPATNIIREDSLKLFAESVKATAIEQLGVAPEDIMKILPCSPLQEAMLTQKKGVNTSTYYNHTVLHLRANPTRLKKAWEHMAERHDIMRTCFCVTEDSRHAYAQVVLKKLDLPWTTFEVEATREQIDKRIDEISRSMSINSAPYAFSLFAGATLVMSFHHSLYDGYAMGLLLDDVRSAYLGLELPIRRPFDRVLEYMENIDPEASDSFWRGLLTGFEASAFPDLTGKTALFKEETKLTGMTAARMTCSKTLSEIEEGCREISTSLLALGQTGWARLLAAYSGETDVCFGSVVSGRTIPVDGVEDVIAPCFNTVPLRVQLTPGATNLTVMNSIRSLNADILPYQLTPLRRIMNTLKTEGQALFDTLFILQYANEASEDLWEEVDDRGEMDFSVVVELVPNRNRNSLDIVLYFRRDVILEEQVDVIIQQLNAAIIDSLQYPDELAINFREFKPSILARANSKSLNLEGEGYDLLHSEFERHARENPSYVALEFLDNDYKITSWTFRELNEAANRVAHYLVSLGLKRDEAVPLCLEKSPLFYICVLGVLKAGCAFTPIDPTLPDQRKMFMIEELGARVVLVTAATAGGMGRVAMVDVESGVMDSQPVTNLNIKGLTPRCLAYRLYTSGSTGQPKAVSLEIKSAVQTFRASKSLIPWKSDSRLLQFAATTFDMCYYDCFMAWSYGFTLCSAAKKHLLGDLEGTIMTMKATLLDLTPTVAATLVAENLTTVEMLYCIGEAMPQKVVNDWDGRCVNSYGPTEAAMCCTITATDRYTKSSNIGKPFPTASFFVLSRSGEYVVPIFGSGELCIGGPQVAREYHNNIQLTKRQFIQLEGGTVYRTGDLVRMLGDGTFEFLGRADDQVKIRGLRVELDEISSVLRSGHRDIKDATTIVVKHSEGTKEQLVSFLAVEGRKQHGTKPKVLKAGPLPEEIQSSALKAARTKLPRYMIPAVVLIIDHVPRSAAGKVDKKALGAFFREQDIQSFGAAGVEEDESVWSEGEKKIRSVFSQISRVPVQQISRNSTIYEIGLDSISAAQVAMQLKRIDLEISVLDILERPSIKQLSKLLTTDSKHIEAKSQISGDYLVNFNDQFMDQILKDTGIAKDRIAGVFPCTPAQEGMLSQFLRSKGGLYFNHSVFKLPQNVDLSRLRKSWNAVSDSHDMLRAGFVEVEHNTHAFATIIYAQGSVDLPWTIVDSRGNKDIVLSAQKELGASRALENLHLPPWSVTVIRESAMESLLLFSAHHALYDAETLSLFLNDVFSEYSGKRVASRPKFSAVLSNIVKHSLDAEVIEEDKTFWLQQLKGTSISRFPNLCPVRFKSTSSHVCSTETSWSLSMIESRCRKLGISVNSAGQAAWARVLSAYMGDTAVTMGIVLSGRSGIVGAENVAFPCITTVPSLCLLTGTNLELALALQHSNAQALKHQHTPLRNIQGWFEHRQESFFDSIFVYQKTESSSKSSWEIVEEDAFVDYTISLEIEPTNDDSLLIRATCRDNVMPKEQTQLLIQQVNAALVDILQNPNSSSIEFLSFPPALLSCTPPLIDGIPTDITLLHKFVEKYRKLTPDKIAFEFATSIQEGCAIKETWTYTQLDEEGNRIANYLLNLGVKTGQIVAICFEKCPEASFAILGILKAGCAFMALDYNAPIDRKAFIVEDSGAKCVLTMDKYAKEFKSKVKVKVVSLESDTEVKISSSETPFIADLKPEDLCYCLYTSGTTGTPKGCELTHENAVQAMLAFQRIFNGHWDSESRFLQFASFHFDVSVMEQYFSWSVGMCVTSAPRDVIFQDLALTINELQITHLDLTPSLAALLRPEDCPSLCRGVFITGGEQLKQEILNTWGETGVIYNGYGPTEVTIGCTMYARVPANGKPSNIGTAFDNVGSFVFTPNTSRPVLRGAIGELCVSGKLVGRGYLNRAALTEEKFPHLKEFNTRIYRTGDLVRILYDGTFDFAGRADDQVKLRGQRLEIGEINETLKQADSRVKAVATLVLKHPKQQKDQLVSFIVLGTAKASSTLDPVVLDDPEHHQVIPILADGCRRKLPVYMVPTHFLPISKMPLSVNNKVDNKKLKEIYKDTSLALLQQISRREEVNEENWTDGEARIRKILAEMTGLQTLEIKHSSTVFELGLDSVSVVGLARKLKKDGFFASTVSLVMKYPGVEQLAAELSKGENNSSQELARTGSINQKLTAFANKGSFEVCERLDLEPDQIEAIVPCTALQEGMILRFIDSEKPLYYNSFSFSLAKSTDTNLLHSAWDAVVKSTGILRTCFCETSDGYAQVVLRDSEVEWREINVKGEGFQSVITDEMMEHVSMNRELHQTPLYLLLLRTPSRIILVVNIFHALYDGNSLPFIFQDVQRAYRNQLKPRTHHFHELVGHILSIDMDGARTFWGSTLAEAKPSNFPQLIQSAADIDHLVQLKPKIVMEDVEKCCKKLNCTPQSIFQAAWANTLSPYLGHQFAFGVVVSGRSLPIDGVEDTIGPMFNTIPCSLDVKNASSWEKLIQQAHKFNSESITYHHTPLRLINKLMHATSEKPLFDTLFVYQKDPGSDDTTEAPIWNIMESSAVADYPLALEIEESYLHGLNFSIVAKSSVLTTDKSLGLLSILERNIKEILQSPLSKPSLEKTLESDLIMPKESNDIYTNGQAGFQWGPNAKILRSTIAKLADIGESEVDEDSSIFELGLDSIEAIKLSSRLRSSSIKLSVSTIMRNPTIRKMHEVLSQSTKNNKTIPKSDRLTEFEQSIRENLKGRTHTLDLDQIEAIYPATPLQEGMIAETLASDYKLYFNHDVLELDSTVDIRQLRNAWELAFQNSEILRTSFFKVSDISVDLPYSYSFGQAVHKRPQLRWKEVLISSNTRKAIKAAMQQAAQNVNMLQEPPLQITIVKSPMSNYLILSMSHALYDGWSLGLLHEDVQNAYLDSPSSRPSCRPLLEDIFSVDPKDSNKFWKQMLAGSSPSMFQTSTENSPAITHRFEKPSALPFWRIQSFCKQMGVTVQSLGQMCWALLLAHHLGEPDVLFGTVLSGRDIESADEMLFPAMNTVPVRAIAHGDYKDMLRYIQDNSARVLKYQHTPLRQIQKLVDSQGQRLFDTLFIYQRGREQRGSSQKPLWSSVDGTASVEYNICIEMEHCGDNLLWRNACKSTVLSEADSESLLQTLDSLLVHIVNNTDHPAIVHHKEGIEFGNIPICARRSDSTTSLNGLRIDLDETANKIRQAQSNTGDAAAIVASDNGRQLLVVFITKGQSIHNVASFARHEFPHWSMPSFIIPMSTLPHKDGKIDRSQLESHFLSMKPEKRDEFAVQEKKGEWTSLELTFRRILSAVSQLPESEIERTQTIFHLGLDSISAISFSSKLREQLIFLSVAEILRAATIERMAAVAKTMNDEAPKTPVDTEKALEQALGDINIKSLLGGIPEASIESVAPATAGQVYMLSAWKNSNYTIFMPTFTFRCRKIEHSRILSAWESLVRQEPILRTTFLATDSEDTPLVQVTFRNPATQTEWYQSSTTNNDSLINFFKSQEQSKSVDLEQPPVRLTTLITPVDTIIFLTIHHALYDGVSLPLLLSKFQGFLDDSAERLPTPEPEAPRFLDFVSFAHSQDVQQQSRFWSKYLDGAVSTPVPLKYPDLQTTERTELFRTSVIDKSNLLESRCRAEGVSLQSIFLAAYAKVYAYHLDLKDGPVKKKEDVIFGIYLSNRHLPIPDLAIMAAPTLNLVPLRIRSPRTTTLVQLARQVQADLTEIGSAGNGTVGLWQVEKWTGVQVDCFFNYLKMPGGDEAAGGDGEMGFEDLRVDVKSDLGAARAELPEKVWMDSAKTHLDIEVAVYGDKVDIGVFSTAQTLNKEDANNTIEWMRDIVMGIL